MSKYKQVQELLAGSALDGWAFRFSFLTASLSNANSNQMNNLQRFKLGKIFQDSDNEILTHTVSHTAFCSVFLLSSLSVEIHASKYAGVKNDN